MAAARPGRELVNTRTLRRRIVVSVAVATVLLFSGCATDAVPPDTAQLSRAPSVTFAQIGIDTERAATEALVDGVRRVGVAMASAAPSSGSPNTVVSPWSAVTAIGMVRAGAGDAAGAQIDRVLGTSRPQAIAALLGQLGAIGGDPGTVDVNNPPSPPVYRQGAGAFIAQSRPARRAYLTDLARYFDAGVYPLDFATPQAQRAMNEWVAVNTGGQITSAPVSVGPDTDLALLTTVFLAAAWASPFTPDATRDEPFTTATGRVVSAPLMGGTFPTRLANGPGWTAAELPYAGAGLAMQVILPASGATTRSLLSDGVLAAVSGALRAATPTSRVEVTVPRWKTDASIDLGPVLDELGMGQIFVPGSLEGIAPGAEVSSAGQTGVITVGERGTVAAATTGMTIVTGVPQPPEATFTADRSFVYQIVDTATGLPVFLGTMNDPSAS
ncbi:serpin family protein [Williamsia sp. MIQD14]|uniref:serpin family protein n=1 Tax=Williamsia sp. MIQD14 TaxID=3425703 RepID=UPI003DA04D7B